MPCCRRLQARSYLHCDHAHPIQDPCKVLAAILNACNRPRWLRQGPRRLSVPNFCTRIQSYEDITSITYPMVLALKLVLARYRQSHHGHRTRRPKCIPSGFDRASRCVFLCILDYERSYDFRNLHLQIESMVDQRGPDLPYLLVAGSTVRQKQ